MAEDVRCRLIVSWRRPSTSTYHAVGLLEQTADGQYRFAYLKSAQQVTEFRPLVGFSDLSRRYESPHLFALFAERVMDPARPDRERWLEELGLTPNAGPMEVLSRTAGQRQGDRLELTPVPCWSPSTRETSAVFLAHGVRHHAGARETIARLRIGDRLDLRPDLDNPHNPRALAVTDRRGTDLGWVPDPLLPYVHEVRRGGADGVTVVVANGADVDPHIQLVVGLSGVLPRDFVDPFDGADWVPAAPA
jgi:hypothetical protein